MDKLAVLICIFIVGSAVEAFSPAFEAGFSPRKRCPQELVPCPERFVLNWTECLCYGPVDNTVYLDPGRTDDIWTDINMVQQDVYDEEIDVVPVTMTMLKFTAINQTVFNPAMLNPAMLFEIMFKQSVFNPTILNETMLNQTDSTMTVLNKTTMNKSDLGPKDMTVLNTTDWNTTMLNATAWNQTVLNPNMLNPAVFHNIVLNQNMFRPTQFNETVSSPTVLNTTVFSLNTLYFISSWIQEFSCSALLWIRNTSAAVLPWHPAYLVLVEPAVWAVGLGVTVIQLVATKRELARTHAAMGEYRSQEEVFLSWWRSHEEENSVLRKRTRFLRKTAKTWKGKHHRLLRQLEDNRKSLRATESSSARKDHKMKVLSDLLVDLEMNFDLRRGDARDDVAAVTDRAVAARGSVKRLMVDVCRVQAELSVAKLQRDAYRARMDDERRACEALEGKWRILEQDVATLRNDKNLVENQLLSLQLQNKVTAEMFQHKEAALRRLVSEELDRRQTLPPRSETTGRSRRAEKDEEKDEEFYRDQLAAWQEVFKSSLDTLHIMMDEQRGALQDLQQRSTEGR